MPLPFALPPVIFFDAVGTLIYPEPSAPAIYAAVGRRFGSRLDEATLTARFRAAFRRQEEADYVNGLRTDESRELARWRTIVGEVLDDVIDPQECFRQLYDHFARPESWRCAAEAGSTLAALRAKGHRLGIASNFDWRLHGIVQDLPALEPIQQVVVSSEVGWRKPAEEFFAEMCQRAGVEIDQILYVGDDPINDYEGARTAGVRSVLIDPYGRTAVPPEASLRSLGDLFS